MRRLAKVNFLDSVNGPKFKRRELSEFSPVEPSTPTEESYQDFKPRKTSRGWRFFIYFFLIILTVAITFSSNVIFSSSSLLDNLTKFSPDNGITSIWGHFKKIIMPQDRLLQGEDEDRVNILLLGQGGIGHEGAFLTDTIMLVSIKPSTKQVAAISIPRDLYAPIADDGWRKVNFANAYGETKNEGQGGITAAKTISNILAIPVHYYFRLDFEAFEKAIDDLNGVTVYIDQGFTDSQYPTEDYSVTTITFNEGWQKMDGATALKFVRSRHGNNGEGSDFARSRRQQKVILALKDKLFSLSSLLQPQKLISVLSDFKNHLATNMETWEMIRLAKLSRNLDLSNITAKIFDDSPDGELVPFITEDGAYVLKTKTGDFNGLANIAQNIFDEQMLAQAESAAEVTAESETIDNNQTPNTNNQINPNNQETITEETNEGSTTTTATTTVVANTPAATSIKISALNGTWETGLAKKTADEIQTANPNFEILKTGNAPTHDYKTTKIYNLTLDNDAPALGSILEVIKGELENELPDTIKNEEGSDVIIILGTDNAGGTSNQVIE